MRYGSICSGIEAASVAWSDFGWECAFTSEIDPFCSSLLKARYPEVPNLGDVTKIRDVPSVDLLVGGTPCQSFSVTGLRSGTDDDRGVLIFHFLRVAQRTNPSVVVWENVPGVLSSGGGRDFGSFLGGLEELGYGWAYRTIDARFFGGPHHRRRVFVVGCSRGRFNLAARAIFELEHSIEDPRQARKIRKTRAGGCGASGYPGWGLSGDETPKLILDASPTLRASQGGEGNIVWRHESQWHRRRPLSILERERIMGFPDGYTAVEHKGKPASDSTRRHAIGNSMDTRVMKWIGKRILASGCLEPSRRFF